MFCAIHRELDTNWLILYTIITDENKKRKGYERQIYEVSEEDEAVSRIEIKTK